MINFGLAFDLHVLSQHGPAHDWGGLVCGGLVWSFIKLEVKNEYETTE